MRRSRTNAPPQKLRETAALVKSTALQLGQTAAKLVGAAERLRLVAEFNEGDGDADGGEPPP